MIVNTGDGRYYLAAASVGPSELPDLPAPGEASTAPNVLAVRTLAVGESVDVTLSDEDFPAALLDPAQYVSGWDATSTAHLVTTEPLWLMTADLEPVGHRPVMPRPGANDVTLLARRAESVRHFWPGREQPTTEQHTVMWCRVGDGPAPSTAATNLAETAAAPTDTLFDDVVDTDYGQFTIEWGEAGEDVADCFAGQANGWVGAAAPGCVWLVLGRRSGGSAVRIVLESAEPQLSEDWEDVVEVSFEVPTGVPIRWLSWAGETGGDLDIPAGTFRLRASAIGRDAGAADEFAEEVLDRYLVEIWPDSGLRPDIVVRTTSANAAYWNATWGSAP